MLTVVNSPLLLLFKCEQSLLELGIYGRCQPLRSPTAVSYIPVMQHAVKDIYSWAIFLPKEVTKPHTTTQTWLCISQAASPQPPGMRMLHKVITRRCASLGHPLCSGPNINLQIQSPNLSFSQGMALWPLQTHQNLSPAP